MNKNDFMKAMSMIDEDLIQEAGAPDEVEITDKKSEFYDGDQVSGVDVYRRNIWKKVIAAAATFVIVAGSVGGGAYCFSRFNRNKDNGKSDSVSSTVVDNVKYDCIYSKLKANRDKCIINAEVQLFDSTKASIQDINGKYNKELFDFLDSYDMKTEAPEDDFCKMPKSIEITFETNEETSFIFELYENRCFTWTEKSPNSEKTTYHILEGPDGNLNQLLEIFGLDTVLTELDDVSKEEIDEFIDNCLSDKYEQTAFKHMETTSIEYEIIDKEALRNDLSSFVWKRESSFSRDNCYDICGLSLDEFGCMAGEYNGYYVVYRLEYYSDYDKYNSVRESYIKLSEITSEQLGKVLSEFCNETTVQWLEGPTYIPQGRDPFDMISRYYTITDPNSFIDEIAEIEWVSCSSGEFESNTIYKNENDQWCTRGDYNIGEYGYGGKLIIAPNGYMRIAEFGDFKLKNESDTSKLEEIFSKYLVMDERTKIAEKISKGITDYDNLKAHFTYQRVYNDERPESFDGDLSIDAKNEKLYFTGEGINIWSQNDKEEKIELVMNGHDKSAFKITYKETGETNSLGLYSYANGYTQSPPDHYIYLCKQLENSLAPRMLSYYNKSNTKYEVNEADGKTEITWHYEDGSTATIVLTERGQLLSYETSGGNYTVSFKLDNYVFDSPDFTIEDTAAVYDAISAEEQMFYQRNNEE